MIRITPVVISVLDYAKGFGHSDLVTVSEREVKDHVEILRHNWLGAK
jgi:hypothetical protein